MELWKKLRFYRRKTMVPVVYLKLRNFDLRKKKNGRLAKTMEL